MGWGMLALRHVPAGFAIPRGVLLGAHGLLYSVCFIIGRPLHYPHAQRDARCEERLGFGNHAGISTNLGDGYGNNPARDGHAVASVRSNCAVLGMVRTRLPVCSQTEEGRLMRLI